MWSKGLGGGLVTPIFAMTTPLRRSTFGDAVGCKSEAAFVALVRSDVAPRMLRPPECCMFRPAIPADTAGKLIAPASSLVTQRTKVEYGTVMMLSAFNSGIAHQAQSRSPRLVWGCGVSRGWLVLIVALFYTAEHDHRLGIDRLHLIQADGVRGNLFGLEEIPNDCVALLFICPVVVSDDYDPIANRFATRLFFASSHQNMASTKVEVSIVVGALVGEERHFSLLPLRRDLFVKFFSKLFVRPFSIENSKAPVKNAYVGSEASADVFYRDDSAVQMSNIPLHTGRQATVADKLNSQSRSLIAKYGKRCPLRFLKGITGKCEGPPKQNQAGESRRKSQSRPITAGFSGPGRQVLSGKITIVGVIRGVFGLWLMWVGFQHAERGIDESMTIGKEADGILRLALAVVVFHVACFALVGPYLRPRGSWLQ